MRRWRSDVGGYVYDENTALEENPNWINELLDYYFPDSEKIGPVCGEIGNNFDIMTTFDLDLIWRSDICSYVYKGNAETDNSSDWVNELLNYYFPNKETIDLARGKTRINFRFWKSGKVLPGKLIYRKLVG